MVRDAGGHDLDFNTMEESPNPIAKKTVCDVTSGRPSIVARV